ncbi:Pyruvate dehydrogenase E1 component [compost metagenome]
MARQQLHQPLAEIAPSHVAKLLAGDAPVIAATDYVRAYPQLIAPYVAAPYAVLGTDGYGRSDNRPSLRRFFEVDRVYVCLAALRALAVQGTVPVSLVAEALARYGVDAEKPAPFSL